MKYKDIMKELGISSSLKGYEFLGIAVAAYRQDLNKEQIMRCIMERYPDTSRSRIDRNIRHVIDNAYKNADPALLKEILGNVKSNRTGKATLMQFIAALSDYYYGGRNEQQR